MLGSLIFAPLLAAQVVFAPRPVPPPAPAPGTAYFDSELERKRKDLRDQCMSEAGIGIVLDAYTQQRRRAIERPQEWQVHERAVAIAAWTEPFDAEAFREAIEAQARFRAEREIEMAQTNLAILDALSPADQKIHAHSMTTEIAEGYRKPC